jgi:hypothetical protein
MTAMDSSIATHADHAEHDAVGIEEQEAQPSLYLTLEAWVTGYFTPMFLHRVHANPRLRWCHRWWDHAEAIARLTVLWRTWEAARWEPAGKPAWWLDLDHHLTILLGPDGPLRRCRTTENDRPGSHEPAALPAVTTAPDGWWD